MQLEGKRIVVTGGASGIAAATVQAFVREGAAVVSLDINDTAGEQVVKEASSLGPGPVAYRHCDIRFRSEVDEAFAFATEEMGGLDALAMIAGNEAPKSEDINEQDIEDGTAVHVKGTILTNQAAFLAMRDQGGSIINYASFAGVDGYEGIPIYSAAKGAVLAYSRAVAKAWGRHGVRVNCVCPAAVTPMYEAHYATLDDAQRKAIDDWLLSLPMARRGTTSEIAAVNVFLASDASSFVTGQTIGADGGMFFSR